MPNSDTSRFWIAAEGALALTMLVLPASFGGAPEWTAWLLLGLSSLSCGLWLLGASRNHRRMGWHAVLLGPVIIAVVGLVQLVPLPPAILGLLSPPAAELREFALVPLGLTGWRPLSMDPPSTARAIARALSLGMVLLTSLELGRLPRVRRRLFGALALAGVLTALIGFVHLLAGMDLLFGVHAFGGNVPLLTPFGNTNHLAAWLLLTGTVSAGLAMGSATRDEAIGWAVGALLCGVGVFFTFSRGGIASFVATWALVGASVLARRGGGLKSVLPWVLIGGTVLVAGGLSFEQLLERAETVSSLEKLRSTKLELWPMFFEGLAPYWKLGAGLGAFELAFSPAQTTDLSVTFTHPEFIGLQWWSDVGAPLALVFLILAFVLVRKLWPLVAATATERTAFLALVGLSIHDVFDFALELNGVVVGACVVLGLLCALDEGGRRIAVKGRGLALGAIPVALAASLLAWGTPGHLRAERSLSESISAKPSFDEVRTLAVRLIDRHPADWVLYANVAQEAARSADPLESLAWVNRVLTLRPFDARSHVAAARALARMGRPLQALGELKLAWGRGDASTLEWGLNIAAHEKAWDRALLPTRGHLERAYTVLRSKQRVADAQALLQTARELPPSDEVFEEAQVLAVRHEADLGRPAEALAALKALPVELQRRADLVMTHSTALAKLGRVDEAADELEKLLGREPSNLSVGFMLADLRLSQRRPAAAREVLQRLRPFAFSASDRSSTFTREAAAWLQEDRLPRALDALQTASRIEPARADLHYRQAEVYELMGSLHSALDEVRKGRLQDSPEGARAQDPWVSRLQSAMNQLP